MLQRQGDACVKCGTAITKNFCAICGQKNDYSVHNNNGVLVGNTHGTNGGRMSSRVVGREDNNVKVTTEEEMERDEADTPRLRERRQHKLDAATSLQEGEKQLAAVSAALAATPKVVGRKGMLDQQQARQSQRQPPSIVAVSLERAGSEALFDSYQRVERSNDVEKLKRTSSRPTGSTNNNNKEVHAIGDDLVTSWTKERHNLVAQMDRMEQVLRSGQSVQVAKIEQLTEENARLRAEVERMDQSLKLTQAQAQQKSQDSAARIKALTATNTQLQEKFESLQQQQLSRPSAVAAATAAKKVFDADERARLMDELQEWKARALEAEAQTNANQELIDATVRIADSILNKSARLQALEAEASPHHKNDSSFADFDPTDAPIVGSFDIIRTPPAQGGAIAAKWNKK